MSTKADTRRGGLAALAVSGWPLRRKVALALAIPLLSAGTLGGVRVQADLREATNSSTSARQVTILGPAVAYLVAAERGTVGAHTASQTDLDAAAVGLKTAAAQLASTKRTADLTPAQSHQVDVVLDLSRALREDDVKSLSPGTWMAQLRQIQSGVTQLITTIVNAQLDPEPRLELLAQTLGARFSLAVQQGLVATQRSGDTGSLELFSELGAESVAIERLASQLGATEPVVAKLRTANAERFRTVRTKGTDLGGPAAYIGYDDLVAQLLEGIDNQLSFSANDARRSALVNAAAVLIALLATVALALLVSRLILGPIRRVREGALSVANEQLPEAVARLRAGEEPGEISPIDVTTHEEVGELARAVDDLHRQAIRLASGEAKLKAQVGDMFVTLSRRNTTLVNQQLALIEALEKDEEDPKRLESLFRLDHLAARMRRTGDSLLILADAPSRSIGQEALTVGDAMQAATSGVQDYQRVQLGAGSDVRINPSAAADVVHLLTELVDNALAYSPPHTQVVLTASPVSSGVLIEVADSGLGIPGDTLAELNQTLRSGGDVTPDTARRMGVFVVSRLARRHGINADLRLNAASGITASVLLPFSVLTGASVQVQPEPTPVEAPVVRQPVDDLDARISQAMGIRPAGTSLPTRQKPKPLSEPQPEPQPEPEPVATVEPVSEPAVVEPAVVEPVPTPEPARLTVVPPPAQPVAAPEPKPEPEPLPAPVASVSQSDDADTPIFRAMRSAWLSPSPAQEWATSEVEAGWEEAERVATVSAAVNESGLPQRRPGAHLVPGGVTKPKAVIARDPEAIKARYAAHAAGVSRGRRIAAGTDHDHTEAGPA